MAATVASPPRPERSGTRLPRVCPLPVALTDPQKIALCARIIADAGLAQDVAGHITQVRSDGQGMWSTPYGKWWFEQSASDMLVVDQNGQVLEGPWDVSPAIMIHTEIHRRRPDARVIIHNHPHYATLLATLGVLPEITEQQAVIFDGEMALFDEFTGSIDSVAGGTYLAEAIGGATVILLANHGLLILAETIEEAAYRYITFERCCKLNYEAMASGRKPSTVPEELRSAMKPQWRAQNHLYFWNGAVRQLLTTPADVLA
jgi:ribulose-5-phosphate 4-epimerase/fuculose-1-phosphate aldolase